MPNKPKMAMKPLADAEPKIKVITAQPPPRDSLMVVKEAADYLRVSKSFLDKARLNGDGPAFSRIGRKILYRRSVIDAWVQKRQFSSTSEYENDV